jgi:hypothetical protein
VCGLNEVCDGGAMCHGSELRFRQRVCGRGLCNGGPA